MDASLVVSALLMWSHLTHAKGLWSRGPATYNNIIREAFPIGNGKLGALPFGPAGVEQISLNVDSLWSGGPFENSSYTGGNPALPVSGYLSGIRDWIFHNGTGNVTQMLGSGRNYGSYTVLGNLSITIDGVDSARGYNRFLDLDTGIHTTSYSTDDGNTYTSTVFCSYPDQVCVYDLTSSTALPEITISLQNSLTDPSAVNVSCDTRGYVRLTGVTQLGPPMGMQYDAIARLVSRAGTAYCNSVGALVIPAGSLIRTFSLVIAADTDYDQTKGNKENEFSFRGEPPGPRIEAITTSAAAKAQSAIREAHIADYRSLANSFTLELPDTAGSAGLDTSELITRYSSSDSGDPYLESTLFALGRHLFISSERENSLPTNLQGRWAQESTPAWGADYHANINFQMNHWGADETGLGSLQLATWNYIENTWVPRGSETARLLYGSPSGWVTHNEMNIFGHTGMKEDAQWANYPAAAAWMMLHVWDHFEYSQNTSWLKAQGYPLLKGVAQFWVSQLQEDSFFNDGTLVVNPCNSPEHGPTTFGCTHYQQLIFQIFDAVLTAAPIVGEIDSTFINNVTSMLGSLDKGLHIGSWGEVKEWKLPDSYGYDFKDDTHRHLSNLVGWYPGYSISSLLGGYANATIQKAIQTTLESRGNGTGADADAGWEKVWRSACWARLNNTEKAYFELRYAIDKNFANNGLSMYSGQNPPFQIDANYGLVGAVLAMLVVDLPALSTDTRTRSVVLGPAIPKSWGGGRVKGLRLRGGGYVDFHWDSDGLVTGAHVTGRTTPIKIVNKQGKLLASL